VHRAVRWVLANYHRFMSVRTSKTSDEGSCFHLRRSAELGDKWAQNNLGVRLANGNGVPQDHAEAVRWFRASALAGFPLGAANLGWAYQSGRGVSQDLKLAAEWYSRAVRGGHAESEYNLALLYLDGAGVQPDRDKAVALLNSASKKGLSAAMKLLSRLEAEPNSTVETDARKSGARGSP
jgi:TPR repeat protein